MWTVAVLCGALVVRCGERAESPEVSLSEQPSTAATAGAPGDSVGAPDSSGAAVVDSAAIADPFAGFQLEAGPGVSDVPRQIALRLRNDSEQTALVYADGGAGEVLLDSVPPKAESRIDVVTRAGTISLRSVSPDGTSLRSTEVTAGLDTVVEVIVGRGAPTP